MSGCQMGGAVGLQQPPEAIACVLMLARDDARGLDGRVQASEALIVVRLHALLHPVHPVRRKHLGNLEEI